MPDPTTPRPRRIRPFLTEADYVARAKRQSDLKSQQYQRARDRQAARGVVELWRWVPEVHAELIRNLVADICAELENGCPPEQILSVAREPAVMVNPDKRSTHAAQDDAVVSDHADIPDADDDPARWQGTGLKARRRAQARRADNRKKEAGLKKIRLVVPGHFKPMISDLLKQILAALEAGLLPTIDERASLCDRTRGAQDTPQAQPTAVSPILAPPLLSEENGAQAGDHVLPDARAGIAPQAPLPAHPRTSSPQEITWPRAERRSPKTPCPLDSAEDHAPLFYEIHAIYGHSGL